MSNTLALAGLPLPRSTGTTSRRLKKPGHHRVALLRFGERAPHRRIVDERQQPAGRYRMRQAVGDRDRIPERAQALDPAGRLVAKEQRRVDRADRCAAARIDVYAGGIERLEHARLKRADRAAALQGERDMWPMTFSAG